LLFSGYVKQPASAVIWLRFAEGRPNAWLRRVLPQVTSGAASELDDPFRLNLAFTYRGLEKLQFPLEALTKFPREFRQGMAHPERSARLGDRALADPAHWEFMDGEAGAVDGVALVYAPDPTRLDERLDECESALGKFGLSYEVLRTYLPEDRRDHFGFRMGGGEPNVRGLGRRRSPGPRLATGEFLVGYRDGVGDQQRGLTAPARRSTRVPPEMGEHTRRVDLGFNGSYLVVRKLEQRVAEFQAFFEEQAGSETGRELLAAKMLGRLPSGEQVASCPLGAHARRANPGGFLGSDERDSGRHRILRRGRLYGAAPLAAGEGSERGLLFLGLNADIGRQFEHVQAQLVSETLPGLQGESDPLLGQGGPDGAGEYRSRCFTIPGEPVRRKLTGLSNWVRVRGGLYGFLPSVGALGYLADLDQARAGP
jgi:hypothetical protein